MHYLNSISIEIYIYKKEKVLSNDFKCFDYKFLGFFETL
jgi:hypothetical protein